MILPCTFSKSSMVLVDSANWPVPSKRTPAVDAATWTAVGSVPDSAPTALADVGKTNPSAKRVVPLPNCGGVLSWWSKGVTVGG